MSAAKKLKHLEIELGKANSAAEKLAKATDKDDLVRMAEVLSTQTRLEREISDVKTELATSSSWRAKLTPASKIRPVAIKWLWPQWIALGKLTILAGAGGAGKTTMALSLTATLTNGGLWPDDSKNLKKGNVIIWSSEDDHADTLIPRLIAAGADLEKVHLIEGRTNQLGESEPFDPASDLDILRTAAALIGGVSLLILDPVVNLIKGDMHKANDVRRGLQGVVDFAEQMDCAVLGISHFSKGSAGTAAADRVIGSQAFSALARTVLVAGKQDNSETRVLARAKSNIADDQGGCSYSIELCTIEIDEGHLIETTKAVWGDYLEGSASEILSTIESRSESFSNDDPMEALKAILQTGKIASQEANKTMTASGYTTKQTRTAREKLKVVTTREGFGKDLKSYWELPRPSLLDSVAATLATNAHMCPPYTMGINEENGHEWEEKARMGSPKSAPTPVVQPAPQSEEKPVLDLELETDAPIPVRRNRRPRG